MLCQQSGVQAFHCGCHQLQQAFPGHNTAHLKHQRMQPKQVVGPGPDGLATQVGRRAVGPRVLREHAVQRFPGL
jgi:hypothetical protein